MTDLNTKAHALINQVVDRIVALNGADWAENSGLLDEMLGPMRSDETTLAIMALVEANVAIARHFDPGLTRDDVFGTLREAVGQLLAS